MTRCRAAAVALAVASLATDASAQGGQNWNTVNADAQRTGWIRTETRISATSVQQTGPQAFQFLWKVKPDAQGQSSPLTQPLILQNLISHKGFKALMFFANADTVWAFDYDLAKVYWTTKISTAVTRPASARCTAGLTSLARNTPLSQSALPGAAPARAGGRGRGSASAGRGPAQGINPNNLPIANAVWAISSGGMVHALNPHVGGDLRPPVRIVPDGARVTGSLLVNDILYATTSDSCGGGPNGVWSVDTGEAGTTRSWDAKGAPIAGAAGPTIGLDNVLYVAAGNAVVALDPASLAQKASFTAETPFTTSPVAFAFQGRDFVAAANQDGRIYLLDAAALGGTDNKTPLARSAVYTTMPVDAAVSTVASWEDPDGTRWILASAHDAVVAFRLTDQENVLTLQQAWTSRNMTSPLPPIVLNDVVFAVARGQSPVLYALDGKTGKEIWNSGAAITTAPVVGPSGQDGQVYVSAGDGTLYAFGIPLEH